MARGESLEAFATEHQIPIITIADLALYYSENFKAVEPALFDLEWADLPIDGLMLKIATHSAFRQREHVILALNPELKSRPTYIRIH